MSNIELQVVPQRRYSKMCTAAVAVTIASGTFALGALFMGSPRAFGLALVLCSAGCLVTHFIARLASRHHGAGGQTALSARTLYAIEPTRQEHEVFVERRTACASSAYSY